MKPFDLKLAKEGHPVCTHEGFPVRLICFDAQREVPLIGLIKIKNREELHQYYINGKSSVYESDYLFMAPVKKTYWMNVYKIENHFFPSAFYEAEERAKMAAYNSCGVEFIKTISFETEE